MRLRPMMARLLHPEPRPRRFRDEDKASLALYGLNRPRLGVMAAKDAKAPDPGKRAA